MYNFNIDLIVVYAFLLITLVVGLWIGKDVKNIREYAIANRMYGTGALTITFLATLIGSSTVMGVAANVFTDGIVAMISCFAPLICMVWMALWIAPKLMYFEGCLTMGDIMGTLYGKYGQVMTGLLGAFYSVCIVSGQVLALGYVYEHILGLKNHWATVVGGLVIVAYSAKGGMRAVTTTDILQFMVLVVVIPMIASVLVHEVGGVKTLLAKVPAEKWQIIGNAKLGYHTTLALFLGVLSASLLSPPIIARMLMARDKQQASDMLLIGATFCVPFFFLIMLIGLATFVLYPTIAPNRIMPHVIGTFFPVGLQGICAAGLIAVIMSTADSFLHAAGLSLSHDVLRHTSMGAKNNFNALTWSQYCTVAIGCLSIALALRANNIFPMIVYGVGMMNSSITLPFVAGVLGLKTDLKSFLLALLISLPVFFVANLWLSTPMQHWAFPLSILANALTFFGTHYLQNGGGVMVKQRGEVHTIFLRRPRWGNFRQWVPTPQKLLRYSQNKVAKYGANPTTFALFFCCNYMVPFFMHSDAHPATYGWILAIKGTSVLLCIGLLLKPYWPAQLLPYFAFYYHFSLLYCLPFVTTFLFLLEANSIEWVVNVALAIMFLIVLVDWVTFVGISILGTSLATGLYTIGLDSWIMDMHWNTKYTLAYAVIFSILIGLLFLRRKERSFDRLANHNQALYATDQDNQITIVETFKEKVSLLKTLKRSGVEELTKVTKLVKELQDKDQEVYKKGSPFSELIQQIETKLIPMALSMERLEQRATDYLRLAVRMTTVDELIEGLQAKLRMHGLHQNVQYKIDTQHRVLNCDPDRIKKVLLNTIIAFNTTATQRVLVSLSDTQLTYPLQSLRKDYVKKVPAISFALTKQATLPTIAPQYVAQITRSESLPMPDTAQELAILANRKIIKAHYGFTNLEGTKADDPSLYIIPIQLRDIRTVDMDGEHMELGTELIRADDTHPGAKEQEYAFLEDVKARTTANIDTIKTAIEAIKWYHGPIKRQSGEPFYLHPIAVAQIVLDYNQDEATLLGALLHDTVEDTPMLLENIEMMFGKDVAEIVDGVTHLEINKDTFCKIKFSAHEYILSLLEVKDKRVWYVKLADRMHNMCTIKYKSHKSQQRTAKETLRFFVPLAERLELQAAAKKLKALCLEVLEKDEG